MVTDEKDTQNTEKKQEAQGSYVANLLQNPEPEEEEESLVSSIEEAGEDIDRRRRERGGKPLGQTAKVARELLRQSSKEKPVAAVQGELFSYLSPEAQKKAIVYNKEEKLLSALIDGIDGGELVYKVVLALAITLYEQSELYGTKESLTGATEMLLPLFEDEDGKPKRKPDGRKNAGKLTAEGKHVVSPCPLVFFLLPEFTKLVNGSDSRPTWKERRKVRAVLDSLREKKVYLPTGNGKWIFTTLIGKEVGDIDPKTQTERIVLELNSVFTRLIKEDFAVIRKDTLRKLKGNQSKMTMRLLHYLLEQHSYCMGRKDRNCNISKIALFNRIAIVEKYKTHPKKREEDFRESLKKMEDCKLIEPIIQTDKGGYSQKGGYYEAIGADGCALFCHFRLNAKYTEDEALE